MPEKTGTITGFIQKRDGTNFGLNLDGDEYLYSFPDKRGDPWDADKVNVGDTIRVEYSPYEKDGKTKQYLAVIERLDGTPVSPQTPTGPAPAQGATLWAKDRLMCRESCAKSASAIIAAAITATIYKPDVEAERLARTVTALAGALESWCLEAVD